MFSNATKQTGDDQINTVLCYSQLAQCSRWILEAINGTREFIGVENSLPSWDDSMLLMFAAAKTAMLVLVVVV
jgi:hypothetical protein